MNRGDEGKSWVTLFTYTSQTSTTQIALHAYNTMLLTICTFQLGSKYHSKAISSTIQSEGQYEIWQLWTWYQASSECDILIYLDLSGFRTRTRKVSGQNPELILKIRSYTKIQFDNTGSKECKQSDDIFMGSFCNSFPFSLLPTPWRVPVATRRATVSWLTWTAVTQKKRTFPNCNAALNHKLHWGGMTLFFNCRHKRVCMLGRGWQYPVSLQESLLSADGKSVYYNL